MKCPVCKKSSSVRFFVDLKQKVLKKKLSYYKCSECFLAFIYPTVTKKELQKVYKSDYFAPHKKVKESKIIDFIFRFALSPYEDFITSEVSQKAKLIDVGCGRGEFLESMQKKGWDVYGIEPFQEAVEIARKKIGKTRVFRGELPYLKFPHKNYEVVTLWHVLEHLVDPVSYIRKIHLLLKHRGYFIIEVPNLDSFIFSIFGKKYNGLVFPEHVFYYSKNGLVKLLEDNQFRVMNVFSPLKLSSQFAINCANLLHQKFGIRWKVGVVFFLPLSVVLSFIASFFTRGEVLRLVAIKQ